VHLLSTSNNVLGRNNLGLGQTAGQDNSARRLCTLPTKTAAAAAAVAAAAALSYGFALLPLQGVCRERVVQV
jgi:hypothetical protein